MMIRTRPFMHAIAILALALVTAPSAADVATAFTYQGELRANGDLANGSFNFEFSLWNAGVAGNQIGSAQLINGVPVANGRFTVELDFGDNPFNDNRWLEIRVDDTTLSPRQPVTPAPVALHLRGITRSDEGHFGIGTAEPNARLEVREDDAQTDAIVGVSVFQNGIVGMAASPAKAGVFGTTTAADGVGVRGQINGVNGGGPAVYGTTAGLNGVGVWGEATQSTGVSYAVFGSVTSPDGYAGYFTGGSNYFEGDVGIGTTAPTARLHIAGGASSTLLKVDDQLIVDSAADFVGVGRSTHVTPAEVFGLYKNTSSFGGMYVMTSGSSGLPFYGYSAGGDPDAYHYYDGGADSWRLSVGGVRMAVAGSTGNVGIGTTNPSFRLEVNGSAGKPGGGSWSNSSDRRLKKNIRDLDGALEALLALRGVTFEYRNPQIINELPGERIGMIAQEVEPIFPDWVERREDGYRTLTFRGFEALTVEALRELRMEKDAEIAVLRERIAQLESLVHQLAASPAGGRK